MSTEAKKLALKNKKEALDADRELRKSATYLTKAYGDETASFPGGEKNDEFYFTRSATDNLPNLAEIARLTSLSSNALSQSLENIAAEIENIGNNLVDYAQNSSITDDIRELPTIIATTAVAIATGGTSLAVQAAAIGGAYLLGEISKQIKEEIGNLQNERSNEASQLNTLDQQISQKQSKLNDPNVSETEKTQIRSELASLVSQRSSSQTRIKGLDEKIESLIKQGNKTVTGGGGLSLLEMDHNTKTKTIVMNMDSSIVKLMRIQSASASEKCCFCDKK
ncbi:12302_t:CDS:2, partial [Funneliformis geosporum]